MRGGKEKGIQRCQVRWRGARGPLDYRSSAGSSTVGKIEMLQDVLFCSTEARHSLEHRSSETSSTVGVPIVIFGCWRSLDLLLDDPHPGDFVRG